MGVRVASVPAALERALELFEPQAHDVRAGLRSGYLDLLAGDGVQLRRPAQRMMASRVAPPIYERIWRPLVARMVMGSKAPGQREEQRIASGMLQLSRGDRVLDLACGTGSFARRFSETVDDGLVVGVDISPGMVAAAVRRTKSPNVAYMRADACALPFQAGSFDAVCCFGALHMFERPMRGLDEIVRVLAPGGRVAFLVSCENGGKPGPDGLRRRYGGIVMFGPDELTAKLEQRGLGDIDQRVIGRAQFVSARRPA